MALLNKKGIDVRTGKVRDNAFHDEVHFDEVDLDEEREALYINHIENLEHRIGKQFNHFKPFNRQEVNHTDNIFSWNDIEICREYGIREGISAKRPQDENHDGRKEYFDPTDVFIDKLGNETVRFNIEKTLRSKNRMWVTRFISLSVLEGMTRDNAFFDGIAQRQHDTAVMLNRSTAEEQKSYENRTRLKKVLIAGGVVLGLIVGTTTVIVPQVNYQTAIDSFAAKNWEGALVQLRELGDYRDTAIYGIYSTAQVNLSARKFDEAKELFSCLLPQRQMLEQYGIDLQYDIDDCDYQKALDMYTSHQYEEAMEIFKSVGDHLKAKEYYNKCGYQIAENHYEAGQYSDALDAFYVIRSYSDSKARMEAIASERYDEANTLYRQGRYADAAPIYSFLSEYGYADSRTMVSQCCYRNGLDLYARGEYENARDEFHKVLSFKDSNALAKECTYRIAKAKQAVSVEDALSEYLSISEYRDVAGMLVQPIFAIYGEWEIVEMNGAKWSSATEFSFNTGGVFMCKKQLLDVAISTDASPSPYVWNGKEYAYGNYTLTVHEGKDGMTDFVASDGRDTVVYTCRRTATYPVMLIHNAIANGEDVENSGQSPLAKLLQEYVRKKTDGIYLLGDTEIDCKKIIEDAGK